MKTEYLDADQTTKLQESKKFEEVAFIDCCKGIFSAVITLDSGESFFIMPSEWCGVHRIVGDKKK